MLIVLFTAQWIFKLGIIYVKLLDEVQGCGQQVDQIDCVTESRKQQSIKWNKDIG